MEPQQDQLAELYEAMDETDLQTEARRRDQLTDQARDLLLQEMRRRGLEPEDLDPEEEDPESTSAVWETVERYRDLSSGIVARSALEASGIRCFLRDENTVRMDWQISNFIGGMRLQVMQADVYAAREVLGGAPLEAKTSEENGTTLPDERCPRCNSSSIHRRRPHRGLALAFLWLFSFPVPQGRAEWHCKNCGWKWTDQPEADHSRA